MNIEKKSRQLKERNKRKLQEPVLNHFDFDDFHKSDFSIDYIIKNQKIFDADVHDSFVFQKYKFLYNNNPFVLYLPSNKTIRPDIKRVYIGITYWSIKSFWFFIPVDLTTGIKTISEKDLKDLLNDYRDDLLETVTKDLFNELKTYLFMCRNSLHKQLKQDKCLIPWNILSGKTNKLDSDDISRCIYMAGYRYHYCIYMQMFGGVFKNINMKLGFWPNMTVSKETGSYTSFDENRYDDCFNNFRKEVIQFIIDNKDNFKNDTLITGTGLDNYLI